MVIFLAQNLVEKLPTRTLPIKETEAFFWYVINVFIGIS